MSNSNQQAPNNYLAGAIVATILFCWPFGIPAIINASRVNGLWNSGNHEAAIQASNAARKWRNIAFILGGIAYAFYFIYFFVICLLLEEFL